MYVNRPVPSFLTPPPQVQRTYGPAQAPAPAPSILSGGPAGPDPIANLKALGASTWNTLKAVAGQLWAALRRAIA